MSGGSGGDEGGHALAWGAGRGGRIAFGVAVAWWTYSDTTGLTQRRAIKRMEDRKVARRERDIQALGMNIHSDRRKREQRKTADAARSQAEQRNK